MNKVDYKLWTKFRESKKSTISHDEYLLVCRLHSTYFNHKYHEPCKCNPKEIKQWINQLNELYEKEV